MKCLFCFNNLLFGNNTLGDSIMEIMFGKLFARRAVMCFFVVMLLLLSCVLRVAVIATGNYQDIQSEQITYEIKITQHRGTIYDCNMVPLTNNEKQMVAVVSPTQRCITAISHQLEGKMLSDTLATLKSNKPAVCYISEDISCDGIATTTIYNRYSDNLSACHLIGYTNAEKHGISGLELAYDDILYSNEYVSAKVTCDGKGNILKGIEPYFENDLSKTINGVVTTLDVNIQTMVEKEISKMNSGCAIVAEVGNSKIRAMASVPTFNINNIATSLDDENSPMLNRALYTFNVGSVFKPCIAIPIIENNLSDITFNCEGKLQIVDRSFKCHNLLGHGEMNLCNSLAQSCNCFFYNAALLLGNNHIYKTAAKLSIGTKIKIADGMYTIRGNLPNKSVLSNAGSLANLSIGQGNLMASPVAMLNLYLAIAGNGSYYVPSVVEKTIVDGKEDLYDIGYPTFVMQGNTASILREYLKTVITDGTGIEAAPLLTTAAGKTATAQTGRYYNDKTEITNSWFCGFFPADNPQYVIVVMSDSKLNVSTASVFANIADEIAKYKGINVENDD